MNHKKLLLRGSSTWIQTAKEMLDMTKKQTSHLYEEDTPDSCDRGLRLTTS